MFNVFMFIHFRPDPSKLDYDSACLVARYLSSKRPFAQSFDIYLTQVSLKLSFKKQSNNYPSEAFKFFMFKNCFVKLVAL